MIHLLEGHYSFHLTIWNVVKLSNPVDISSMKSVFFNPKMSSPALGEISSKDFKEVHM